MIIWIKVNCTIKKIALFAAVVLFLSSCSMLSELVAFTKCEFRLQSLQEPEVCGINVSQKSTWSDFTFTEGQTLAAQVIPGPCWTFY